MRTYLHPTLAAGRWYEFSLAQQMANIGSEVGRAARAQAREDQILFDGAVMRALELFELTIDDLRWRKRLKEITRARELFCAAVLGSNEYSTSLEDLDRYFNYFAYAASLERSKLRKIDG